MYDGFDMKAKVLVEGGTMRLLCGTAPGRSVTWTSEPSLVVLATHECALRGALANTRARSRPAATLPAATGGSIRA